MYATVPRITPPIVSGGDAIVEELDRSDALECLGDLFRDRECLVDRNRSALEALREVLALER
jgi:hypothetical protein